MKKVTSRQVSICHSSTFSAHASDKQGIGIIFIADYFATCFAPRAGPTLIYVHFDTTN
jgi:hypothetical protein